MDYWPLLKIAARILGAASVLYILLVLVVFWRQRSLIYFPSHALPETRLSPWLQGDRLIGYCREVEQPKTVWLMTHGNGGQAADRDYVLPCLSPEDSFYVLEYPGYGAQQGSPSRSALDQAALEAYRILRAAHPHTSVCVLGESLGSGPACVLAGEQPPPDKLVLMVPFDELAKVAGERFPFLPAGLLLRDRWDNAQALRNYRGPVDIFASRDDTIIPIDHARDLARKVPQARLIELPLGHNTWADPNLVRIRH